MAKNKTNKAKFQIIFMHDMLNVNHSLQFRVLLTVRRQGMAHLSWGVRPTLCVQTGLGCSTSVKREWSITTIQKLVISKYICVFER